MYIGVYIYCYLGSRLSIRVLPLSLFRECPRVYSIIIYNMVYVPGKYVIYNNINS